jgi:type II secretion system protein C
LQAAWEPGRDAVQAVPLAGREQGLRLIGTIVSAKPELSYAVIGRLGADEQGIYRTRERVGRTTVVAVLRNQIVVETENGERLRLSVDAEPPNAGDVRRAAVDGPAVADPAAAPAGAEVVRHVPLADVAASFSDPQRVIEEIIASPHLSDGRPDGFYLGRLRAADVLYRIGLRTGDVVKALDGIGFEGPQDAELFLGRLSEGGRISLKVNRHGISQNVEALIN